MFEKTQKAAADFAGAVSEETTQAIAVARAAVIPTISSFFGAIANGATKLKDSVEDGSLFKATESDTTGWYRPDPLPTEEQTKAIVGLRAVGKTDAEIALMLGISIRTVKSTPVAD